uniref:C2H2-type domain-containing protein n=1 Tax=viral metagenome TaxID=1070528 RepID=A0A6C0KP46_9ZZZZ
MEIIGNDKSSQDFLSCEYCDYITCKKSNFDKHLLTLKHKKLQNGNKKVAKVASSDSTCKTCNQKYKTISGLWKHNKKCNNQFILDIINQDDNVKDFLIEQNKLLIEQLSQQNKSLIEQNTKLFEISKNNNTNIVGTMNNVNSNNKFNINLFLNETCKDAINLSDFVNQIHLSVNDLEETGKLGYAEGISKIFIKNLNDIVFTHRPIHCSDSKRDILYIKDGNQWTKDDEQKSCLTKAIKQVANKNIKQIPEWQKANPDYQNPESKQNDKYMKMICEVMSGSTKEEQQKNYNKIIKNIVKEVVIDKNH